MNEDLIAEIQALSAIGSEEKFSEIIRLLKNSTLELRGKRIQIYNCQQVH